MSRLFVNFLSRMGSNGGRVGSERARNDLIRKELFWLGGRDLNPDNVVQSHVSYR